MIQFNVKTGEIETVIVPGEQIGIFVNIKPKAEDLLPEDFVSEAIKKLDEIFPQA